MTEKGEITFRTTEDAAVEAVQKAIGVENAIKELEGWKSNTGFEVEMVVHQFYNDPTIDRQYKEAVIRLVSLTDLRGRMAGLCASFGDGNVLREKMEQYKSRNIRQLQARVEYERQESGER